MKKMFVAFGIAFAIFASIFGLNVIADAISDRTAYNNAVAWCETFGMDKDSIVKEDTAIYVVPSTIEHNGARISCVR